MTRTHSTLRVAVAIAAVALLFAVAPPASWAAAELSVGSDCGFSFGGVETPIGFTNDDTVSGLQFDLSFDATALLLQQVVFTGASDHQLDYADVTPGQVRVLLFSPTNALVPDGDILQVAFEVGADATGSDVPLPVLQAAFGTLASASRAPGVTPAPGNVELALIQGPVDTTVCNGASAQLSASVTGPGTPAFQWLVNGQPVSGATSDTLGIDPAESSSVGIYQVEVSNQCGTGTSEMAIFNVLGICAPTSLVAYATGRASEVQLRWAENPSSEVEGYRVRWGVTPEGPYTESLDVGPEGTLLLTPLPDGQRQYFRVSARVGGFEGQSSGEASAVAADNGLLLPQAPDYGYQTTPSNDLTHPDVITYRFEGRAGDLTLWYDVYDVDRVGEVSIKLNGSELWQPDTTPFSSWAGSRTLVLPDAWVLDDDVNVLTFDNQDAPPGLETWGARLVSLQISAPDVEATAWSRTVDLALGLSAPETPLGGYDIYRSTFAAFFPSAANRIATGVTGRNFRDDAGLSDGVDYTYLVRPIDSIGNPGVDSIRVTVTPSDAVVTPIVDLRAVRSGADDVALTWSPVTTANGVQEYRLFEASAPDALVATGDATASTSFTRAGDLSDGQLHFYWVEVVDGAGGQSSR